MLYVSVELYCIQMDLSFGGASIRTTYSVWSIGRQRYATTRAPMAWNMACVSRRRSTHPRHISPQSVQRVTHAGRKMPSKCLLSNHGLRGSASPVLTATGLVNGRWQFRPLQNRHPLTDRQKICHRWLRRRPLKLCQIWCTSDLGSFWANGWNIT